MKKLLLFAIILIFFHTGSAQNVIDINGISPGLFPELVPGNSGGNDIHHLNVGVYIAKFRSGDYSRSLKIVYRKH